jgi:hypothetical protein
MARWNENHPQKNSEISSARKRAERRGKSLSPKESLRHRLPLLHERYFSV